MCEGARVCICLCVWVALGFGLLDFIVGRTLCCTFMLEKCCHIMDSFILNSMLFMMFTYICLLCE